MVIEGNFRVPGVDARSRLLGKAKIVCSFVISVIWTLLFRSVPEQCQAFGARPGLFRWLKANASKLYLGIIRKPYDPLNPITKNIECFVPNQFPKDPQFTYVTALSWAQVGSFGYFCLFKHNMIHSLDFFVPQPQPPKPPPALY